MTIFGYARNIDESRSFAEQARALRAKGCEKMVFEIANRQISDQPKLSGLISEMQKNDTLVVLSIDKIAKSEEDLKEFLDIFYKRSLFLFSIKGSIKNYQESRVLPSLDCSFLALARNYIFKEADRERAKVAKKLKALKNNDPSAVLEKRSEEAYRRKIFSEGDDWFRYCEKLRPYLTWIEVVEVVNFYGNYANPWTVKRLKLALRFCIRSGISGKFDMFHRARVMGKKKKEEIIERAINEMKK